MYTWRNSLKTAALTLSAAVLLAACGGENTATEKAPVAKAAAPKPSLYNSAMDDIGRPALDVEIAAWDIDVRPDFKGLPVGSGTAEDGEGIWVERCAVCHGDFADSNEVFGPIVAGNITPADIASGHVAALKAPTARSTFMKVATVSTVFDYIQRAMPWNAPKSLSPDEVYSVLAYLLNLAYIIDYDFVLSNETIAEVQERMPNRNGMTTDHGMWKIDGKPDVVGSNCMSNCEKTVSVDSSLPDYAKGTHGNLVEQNRAFGPFKGLNTAEEGEETVAADPAAEADAAMEKVLTQNGCLGCHGIDKKMIGPAYTDVAAKYASRDDAVDYLVGKIRNGGSGVWGGMMPPMQQVSEDQARDIATWVLARK